jgi:peroxiredoxin
MTMALSRVFGAPSRPSLPVGSVAPQFGAPAVDGGYIDLSDYQGKTVVLNFWAFWCDTWKAELPHLKDLAAQQQDLKFTLLAISVDATRVSEFHRRVPDKLGFPVLLDIGGAASKAYEIRHVPTVVVIDPSGHIRYAATGYPGNQPVLSVLRKIANGR